MRVRFQKILFITDLSQSSNRGLPYAVSLAAKFSAKLQVCHVLDFTTAGLYDASMLVLPTRSKELSEDVERKIRELMSGQTIPWEALVIEGDPAMAIASVAEEKGADLVVATTHGRSGLSRVLLGSVVERLLHTLHRPLLTLREPEPAGAGVGTKWTPRRILVGCDFSPGSALALEYALSLAQEFQSELHLLHSIEPTLYKHMDATTGALAKELEKAVENTVRGKLEALASAEDRAWCEIKTAFTTGNPHEELARYAQANKIDLVVVGVRGHSLIDRMLVGSTTDRLVRKALCPILAVETPKK